MTEIRVTDQIELRQIRRDYADELFDLVDKNRQHLRTFLPWLDKNKSVNDSISFIELCNKTLQTNGAVTFGVFLQDKLVGMNGFHPIDKSNRIGAIGYWMDVDHCGQGITSKSTQAVIDYGFKELELNRIEINCAVENIGSNLIAKKLGFHFEGVRRQAEWLYDHFVDHNVYSLIIE